MPAPAPRVAVARRIADRDILLVDMKFYLLSALRVANGEILPFNWSATCDAFLETIAQYEAASEGLADLAPSRAATLSLKQALAGLETAAFEKRNLPPRVASPLSQ